MRFETKPAPHVAGGNSVRRVMFLVLVALCPTLIVQTFYFGWGTAINVALACASAVLAEAIVLKVRGRSILPQCADGSALLTGALLALALPPLAPWWLSVSGAAFAIVIAKHLYGGLGYNLFNPAMVGYAALLLSFPQAMTRWPLPSGLAASDLSLSNTLDLIFRGAAATPEIDAITAATPLATVRAGLILRQTMDEIHAQPIFGAFGGVGWEWVSAAALLGGVALLVLQVIRWHIPVAMLAALLVCATLFHVGNPGAHSGPLFHLFSGATMLGAFFIATDPVTAATSPRGRLLYGAGIGVCVYIIREWGSYPDGVAFAVLTMNAFAPLIDRYTIPRIYGHSGPPRI